MEVKEVTEGHSNYNRNELAQQIKQALANDQQLAKTIYAWLRSTGLKLTDY